MATPNVITLNDVDGNNPLHVERLYQMLNDARYVSKTSQMSHSGYHPNKWVVMLSIVDGSSTHETVHVTYRQPERAVNLMKHLAGIGD